MTVLGISVDHISIPAVINSGVYARHKFPPHASEHSISYVHVYCVMLVKAHLCIKSSRSNIPQLHAKDTKFVALITKRFVAKRRARLADPAIERTIQPDSVVSITSTSA